MGIKESKVRHLLKIAQPVIGIENIIIEDKTDLVDKIDNKILGEALEDGMRDFEPRDKKIISMRFSEEKTFNEIGEEIGVSSQRVCELIKKLLKKLRIKELKIYL